MFQTITKNGSTALAERTVETHLDGTMSHTLTIATYRERMLGWYKSQLGFANGRKARLEVELGDMPASAKDAVRSLFYRFDEAITTAQAVVDELEKQDFWGVAAATGYQLPSA